MLEEKFGHYFEDFDVKKVVSFLVEWSLSFSFLKKNENWGGMGF